MAAAGGLSYLHLPPTTVAQPAESEVPVCVTPLTTSPTNSTVQEVQGGSLQHVPPAAITGIAPQAQAPAAPVALAKRDQRVKKAAPIADQLARQLEQERMCALKQRSEAAEKRKARAHEERQAKEREEEQQRKVAKAFAR